jgi:signal recognition particle subunit SRP54
MQEFQEQLKAMENVGPLGKIAEMIPGLGSLLGNKAKIPENMIEMQGEKAKKWKFAIDSMTPDEKENPEIIEKETSRLQRIAKGAGINTSDVRALLKQYKILKEFVKSGSQELSQKQMMKFARKFGKKIRM